jgi:hypothetical protein
MTLLSLQSLLLRPFARGVAYASSAAANDFQLRPGLVIGAIQTVRARKHIHVTKKVEGHCKFL